MQWFFSFSSNATGWYKDMIKVAVLSALRNTRLEPHCLYDGEPSSLTRWLEETGVDLHHAQVPFRDELFDPDVIARNAGSSYQPQHACGHFLRVLVPDFATGDVVLYTDCDVMFCADPQVSVPVNAIGAVAELDGNGVVNPNAFNSGVMTMNVPHFSKLRDDFISFCRRNGFYVPAHNSYDQVLLNRYFIGAWDALPAGLNWRPWQGVNPDAAIVHYHGPKPHRVDAILRGEVSKEEGLLASLINLSPTGYETYGRTFNSFLA